MLAVIDYAAALVRHCPWPITAVVMALVVLLQIYEYNVMVKAAQVLYAAWDVLRNVTGEGFADARSTAWSGLAIGLIGTGLMLGAILADLFLLVVGWCALTM